MKERECLYVFLKIRIDEMSFLERKEKSLKRHQKSHTNIKVVVYQSFRLLLLLLLHSNHFFLSSSSSFSAQGFAFAQQRRLLIVN